VPLCEQQNAIQEKLGSRSNLAIGVGNVADDQLKIGALRAAEANLRRYIALSRELGIEEANADAHQELGRLLAYRGAYSESETELATALKMFEGRREIQSQCIVWAYRALRELLLLRSTPQSAIGNRQLAIPRLAARWNWRMRRPASIAPTPETTSAPTGCWARRTASPAARRGRAPPARGAGTLPPHQQR